MFKRLVTCTSTVYLDMSTRLETQTGTVSLTTKPNCLLSNLQPTTKSYYSTPIQAMSKHWVVTRKKKHWAVVSSETSDKKHLFPWKIEKTIPTVRRSSCAPWWFSPRENSWLCHIMDSLKTRRNLLVTKYTNKKPHNIIILSVDYSTDKATGKKKSLRKNWHKQSVFRNHSQELSSEALASLQIQRIQPIKAESVRPIRSANRIYTTERIQSTKLRAARI